MASTPRLYLAATGHIYNGLCPDDEQPNARDKECPACRLLVEVERGGWKLVPVEPTPEMEMAARNHHSLTTHYEDHRISIWRAMLDAAPTPLAQASGQDDEMVSLGGTAPPVPRWLLDAVQHIEQYMDAHSPGDWAIGGIQKRQAALSAAEAQASGQAPAASAEPPYEIDALFDALSNLEHDNYERSYSGSKNREADAGLIRAALERYATPVAAQAPRPCTCHPDDRPRGPCREKYASDECLWQRPSMSMSCWTPCAKSQSGRTAVNATAKRRSSASPRPPSTPPCSAPPRGRASDD